MQTLILDFLPLSLNQVIFKAKKHWVLYANEKKKFKKRIIELCEQQCITPIDSPCCITIQYIFPDKRKRDIDNLVLKSILDPLIDAGILVDDNYIEGIKELHFLQPKYKKGIRQTIIYFEY